MRLGPYELGPTEDEHQGIYTIDARVGAEAIPDESVDLIFTDPVYDRIDDYRWLAETAARVLKPDRACLAWCTVGESENVIRAMSESLTYYYTLVMFRTGVMGFCGHKLLSKYQPCMWFGNGERTPVRTLTWDCDIPRDYVGTGKHKWHKPKSTLIRWVQAFTDEGETITDFFTGGGTVPAVCKMLGRRWLAFEIDPATAETARKRVYNTAVPLPHCQPEQLKLETFR